MIYSKRLREDLVFDPVDSFAVIGFFSTPAIIVASLSGPQSAAHTFALCAAMAVIASGLLKVATTLAAHFTGRR